MSLSFFFFNQKTAYELRISDWSSDVCSSDLGRSTLNPAVYVLCALIDVRGYTQSGHVGQKQFASNCSGVSNVACSDPSDTCPRGRHEIGRASCRERVCQYV